jgi:methyl-accepting chemotaxis protein
MRPYRRSQVLIDKAFQLRFALYVVSWSFALSLVFPLLLQELLKSFIRYLALDPMGPPVQALQAKQNELTALLFAVEALFLGLTFLISIFLSHRIAGPVFKLKRAMREAAANGYPAIRFRSADHFQDLADTYNQLVETVRRRADGAARARALIEQALPDAPAGARTTLEQALQQLR